jgi:hypothetical protein
MSSGGSNYSTGMTGGGNQVRIDSPASQQNGYGSAPAPGGKGGFPSAQNPYEQQPSIYMPPSQPSFYQQAFTQPRMEYGLGGMRGGNAYARPYSPGSPIERAPPVDEMRYVSGPDFAPAVMPDTPPMARPAVMPDRRYPVGPMPDMRMSNPEPVEATRGVVPEPNYSGGLGSLMGGMNDYAKQAQQSALATARQHDQAMRQAGAQPYGYFTVPGGGQLWSA